METHLSFKSRGLMKLWICDDLGQLSVNNDQSMLLFPSGRAVIGLPKVVLETAELVGRRIPLVPAVSL